MLFDLEFRRPSGSQSPSSGGLQRGIGFPFPSKLGEHSVQGILACVCADLQLTRGAQTEAAVRQRMGKGG